MVVASQVKTQYVKREKGFVAKTLQITVGENIELNRGDTIVVYPKGKIEIKRKVSSVPEGFNPWYAG